MNKRCVYIYIYSIYIYIIKYVYANEKWIQMVTFRAIHSALLLFS